jgi:hypothetical protein
MQQSFLLRYGDRSIEGNNPDTCFIPVTPSSRRASMLIPAESTP